MLVATFPAWRRRGGGGYPATAGRWRPRLLAHLPAPFQRLRVGAGWLLLDARLGSELVRGALRPRELFDEQLGHDAHARHAERGLRTHEVQVAAAVLAELEPERYELARPREAVAHDAEKERAHALLGGSSLHDEVVRGESGAKVRDQARELAVGGQLLERRRPHDPADLRELGALGQLRAVMRRHE